MHVGKEDNGTLIVYMLIFNAYECELYYGFTRKKIGLDHILRGKVGVVKRGKILHVGRLFCIYLLYMRAQLIF